MIADVVDLEPDDGDVAREVLGWAGLAVFGAAASLTLAITGGRVIVGWVGLALRGSPHQGHCHGVLGRSW